MTGRALTPEQKREVMERIFAAWLRVPELRLGQLVHVATVIAARGRGQPSTGDAFYVEDFDLAAACEEVPA